MPFDLVVSTATVLILGGAVVAYESRSSKSHTANMDALHGVKRSVRDLADRRRAKRKAA
jgi:hypothetical protein